MNTYRINKEDLENKKVLAEGYKIFYQGFKTKHGNYCYADENGNVVGTFHKVDGKIEECNWGLHFSENPFDCFTLNGEKISKYIKCFESSYSTSTYVYDDIKENIEDLIEYGINHKPSTW